MRSIKKKLVLAVIILTFFNSVSAQTSGSGENFSPVTAAKNYYVDAYTGSANFSIPLSIPAAHKTLPQKLNLVYSSRAGNGWLGAGWKLDLGVIERSTKDGYPKYDSTDKFVFSLGEAQNDLVYAGGQEYRPQSADIAWRFVFDGKIWTVSDNLGNTYYFGLEEKLNDFSRTKDPKNPNKIFRWRISKITDTSGNSIIYKYLQDKIEIYYTEKSPSVKNSYNKEDYNYLIELKFFWRKDQLSNCRPGFNDDYPLQGKGRIEEIKLFYQKQLFKTYSLVYEYSLSTGRSLLKGIEECYPDKYGQKNPASVKFSYNEARPVYETIVNENLPGGDKLWNISAAEVQKPLVKEGDSWWLAGNGFRIYYAPMFDGGGRVQPVEWSQTYTQNKGESSGLSWDIEANGNIKIKGKKGQAFHLWTYVTVKQGKELTFSPVQNCNAKIFKAGEYESMWSKWGGIPSEPPAKIYLDKGKFSRIDIIGYNFDDDFSFDLGLGLAEQAEVMNSQEAFIPQLCGDFNGDGVSDLGTFYKETGKCEIVLSVLNGYSTKEVWIENFGKKSEIILGDFNGDGKTDLCSFGTDTAINREWRVALSDGVKFIDQGVWLKAYLPGRIVTGDFNGDGWTDICSTWAWYGDHYRAALSSGKGFSLQEEVTTSSIGTNYSYLGDYNGDGITDFGLLSLTTGTLTAKIEGYKGIWQRTVDSGEMQLGIKNPQFTADIDGDGRASFCHFYQPEGGKGYFYIFDHYNIENICNISGKNAIYGCKYKFPAMYGDVPANLNSGDFNGDGLADFIVYDLAGHTEMILSASNFSDVLTSVENGWGARIELEYKPSAFYENSAAENKWGLPFSLPVVSKVRVFDSADSFQETVYNYSQGYYDLESKEFRGFGYTSSRDEEGNTNEAYFLQDDIYKGKLSQQKIIDVNGKVISELKNTWKNTSLYPGTYIISLDQNSQFINDGGFFNEKRINFEYDAYGNRTRQKESGDLNISGDERETVIEYSCNKSDWLISYPRHIFVQDANGKKVSEKWLYYDNALDNNASPKKGLLSKEEILVSNPVTQKDTTALIQYSYDSFGNLNKLTDAQGRITTYEYDPILFTYQTKVTNAKGQISQYSYDPKTGLLLTSTDVNNQTTKNIYDKIGRLVKVIGPDDTEDNPGIVYEYEFFPGQNLLPFNASFENWEFDPNQKKIKPCGWDSKIPESLSREKAEKISGACSLKVSSAGNSSLGKTAEISQDYKYYGLNGTVTFSCRVKSSSASQARLAIEYNNVRTVSDYHSGNGEWQVLSVCSTLSGYQYPKNIKLILQIEQTGTTDPAVYFDQAVFYNENYKYSQVKLTKKSRTSYSTDNSGKPEYSRYSDYLETISFYDGLGRIILSESRTNRINPQNRNFVVIASRLVYNQRGQVKEKYLPYFTDETAYYHQDDLSAKPKWAYAYDCLGRGTVTTNPDGTSSENIYSGWTTTFIDEKGNQSVSYQDAYNKTIKVEEYNDGQVYTTTYAYDLLGNLIRISDNESNRTEFVYDSLGRKLKMLDPDMGTWSYEYDLSGNLIKQIDAKTQVITFEYDVLNRLTRKTTSEVAAGLLGGGTLVTYTYDDPANANCIGRVSKISDQSGATEFFYDKLGREIKSIKTINTSEVAAGLLGGGVGSTTYTIQREYDAADRLTKLTYPDGEAINYSYNSKSGLLEKVTGTPANPLTGTQIYVSDITYTASGQMKSIKYGNGVSTDYTYDTNSLRLTNILTQSAKGKLQDLNYSFDAVGNISNIQDNLHTSSQSFLYDGLNRLTNAQGNYGVSNYNYDSLGNLTSKEGISFSYNKARPHAVNATSDGISFDYDANGNLSRKADHQAAQRFVYDSENRLVKVEQIAPDAGADPSLKTIQIYLQPGLNCISLPFGTSGKIKDLFAAIQSSREEIAYWDASQKKYLYNINDPDFDQLQTIEYAKAYWIYISNSKGLTLQITGRMPDNYQANLNSGWNSIGCVKDTEADVEKGLSPLKLGSDYTCVRRYNSDGKWQEYSAAKKEFTKLKPCEGYWINVAQAKQWNINNISAGTAIAEFSYDYSGSRVKKSVSVSGECQSTIYVGDLYEIRDTGNGIRKTVKHIFAGANRIATVSLRGGEADEAILYYHSDHLGSSNVFTDASGSQVQLAEYTPFGSFAKNSVIASPEGAKQSYISHYFTGKELDSSTNLYYYGARYYNHTLGKFIQPDPLIQNIYDPQTLNHYSYCRNNPLILTDPDGTTWQDTYNSWSANASSGWDNFWGGISYLGNSLSASVTNSWSHWSSFASSNYFMQSVGGFTMGVVNSVWSLPGGMWNTFTHPILTIKSIPSSLKMLGQGLMSDDIYTYAYTVGNIAGAIETSLAMGYAGGKIRGAWESWRSPRYLGTQHSGIVQKTGSLVIGKVDDFKSTGVLRPGEFSLDWPDQGSPKLNWEMNSRLLRTEMQYGIPIRDISKATEYNTNCFLGCERNLLRNHGWKFNQVSKYWDPPE